MRIPSIVLALAVVVAAAAPASPGGQSGAGTPAAPARAAAVKVPQGNGVPVITDGTFSAGEWDDALAVPVADGVALLVKEYRGVVFVGVRGDRPSGQPGGGLPPIGPTEISLAAPGGPIRKLHVSFGLFEVDIPAAGPAPEGRLGLTTGWYASELRRDETLFARLQKEGKDPLAVMRATAYPSDGIEFAIRRSMLAGPVCLLRLWASAMVGGRPGMVTYPPAAAERVTDGWLELRFRPGS